MNRFLHLTASALLLFVTVAASYTWPEAVVWVAWLNCLLFWMAANVQVERAKLAEVSRDRWRVFARKMEEERDELQKKIERQAGGEDLERAVDQLTEIVELQAAKLARLRPYTEPRLFAAASDVLAAHNDPGNIEAIEEALVRLDQAVAWWDGLAAPATKEPGTPPGAGE